MATLNRPAVKPAVKPAQPKAPVKPSVKPAAPKTAPLVEDDDAPAAAPAKKSPPKKPAAGKPAVKPPVPVFPSPSDMKAAFFEFEFVTDDHGMPYDVSMHRVKGRWDNADAPRFDMREYDLETVIAVTARFAAISFAPNVAKRLPAGQRFQVVLRATGTAAGNLRANLVAARHAKNSAKLKWVWYEDRTDPVFKKLLRVRRILASAFVDVQLPPMKRRGKAAEADE